MRSTVRQEAGTAAIIGFAVAVALYAIAFAVFMALVHQPAGQHTDQPQLDARAVTGLDQILGTAGFTSSQQALSSWQSAPDSITRFGLALDHQPGFLDPAKLSNLTKGNLTADPANGLLDYGEARTALGLGSDYDFHLRTYPLFQTLEDAGAHPIKKTRVAYIADYTQSNQAGFSDYPVKYTAQLTNASNQLWINVTITNNGTVDTVFQAQFSLALYDGVLSDTANTRMLAGDPSGNGNGGSQTVSLHLFRTSSWKWAGADKNVSIVINDPKKKVADFKVDLANYTMTSPSYGAYAAITISPDKMSYGTNAKPSMQFDAWDGNGDTIKNVHVDFALKNGTSTVASGDDRTGGGTNNKWALGSTLPADNYTMTVNLDGDAAYNSTDALQVTDADLGTFTSGGVSTITETATSKYERSLLVNLVDGFANTTYDAGSGDVYPDTKQVMNNDLATNLSAGQYQVLVVGSGVDQTAMTSNSAKDAVKNFVLGGGLLVVMGSQAQQVTWLQPLFHATLTTSGDGLGVPDPSNPILHVPEELAYPTYADNGKTWQFNSDADASHFTQVIVRDGGSNKQQDTLAVSKPGHFGNGTVILTSWMAYGLTSPQNDHEALAMLYNFLMHAAGSLYVDFGPSVPDGAEVASSARMATAANALTAGDDVLVRVVLYVFR